MSDRIRFLPNQEREWIIWTRKRPIQSQICECAVCLDKRNTRKTQLNVLEQIATSWKEPPPSKHRSKRKLKKMRRKTAFPVYDNVPKQLVLNAAKLAAIFKRKDVSKTTLQYDIAAGDMIVSRMQYPLTKD